jgi:hypothetical protein
MAMRGWVIAGAVVLLAGLLAAQEPVAPPAAQAVTFVADTSQVPHLQPWGRAAEALCVVWYPRLVDILASDDTVGFQPTIRIIFEKEMKGVAYSGGNEIHIAASWVEAHPHDFGMVVHELTHQVQRYPPNGEGWLVEGIADYVRQRHFEPDVAVPAIDFARAKPTDAYKTTAGLLIWIEANAAPGIVKKLNRALREQTDTAAVFSASTGKTVAELWAAFARASGYAGPLAAP